MPRASDGTWSDIPNITAVPGQTIESADWNGYRADLRQNEFNAARPIVAGGTGATTPEQALINLGGVGVSNFLDAYAVGDFYETIRTLDENWLRRDGALYEVADYPELAALLPDLTDNIQWASFSPNVSGAFSSALIRSNVTLVATSGGTGGTTTTIWSATNPEESFSEVATIPSFGSVDQINFTNNVYCLVGYSGTNGVISYSNDGTAWSSPQSVIAGYPAQGIVYGAGLYVIVGYNGQIRTSPDLVNWTPRTSGTTKGFEAVTYANGAFVAVGQDGLIATSPDGIAWVIRTSGVTVSLRDATYGAGKFVVVGFNGAILTSTNLAAWILRTSGTTSSFRAVAYSSSGFVAVGTGGVARLSEDGINWSASITGVSPNLEVLLFDPDLPYIYYAFGSGTYLKGTRTLPTQFQVPKDAPAYGWIRALPIDD